MIFLAPISQPHIYKHKAGRKFSSLATPGSGATIPIARALVHRGGDISALLPQHVWTRIFHKVGQCPRTMKPRGFVGVRSPMGSSFPPSQTPCHDALGSCPRLGALHRLPREGLTAVALSCSSRAPLFHGSCGLTTSPSRLHREGGEKGFPTLFPLLLHSSSVR